jgi:hypothetical protein
MIRLGASALSVLVAGTAVGQRAAGRRPSRIPEVARAMTTAARALLESVRGEPEFSERLRSYSMEDKLKLTLASPEREKWAYWPTERSGLSFDLMHAKHRALTHELLWLLLSNRGYHKLLNIMQLENVLQATSSTGFPRGIEEIQRDVVRRAERHGALGLALRRPPHLAVDHGRARPRDSP